MSAVESTQFVLLLAIIVIVGGIWLTVCRDRSLSRRPYRQDRKVPHSKTQPKDRQRRDCPYPRRLYCRLFPPDETTVCC